MAEEKGISKVNNRQLLIEIMCTRIPGASPYWAGKAADVMLAKGWSLIAPRLQDDPEYNLLLQKGIRTLLAAKHSDELQQQLTELMRKEVEIKAETEKA
jgi:hypothetical protein